MDKFRQNNIFIKPYNKKIEIFFENVNPINRMIQKASKNCKYNLIIIINILHKLVEAFNIDINFNSSSISSKNISLNFFCCIFLHRKKEKNS